MSTTKRRRNGFTLIELLTVSGIVVVLIAMLMPAVMLAREAARLTQCKSNLKQIGMAMHGYHEVHSVFPAGWLSRHPADRTGGGSWAWAVVIWPEME